MINPYLLLGIPEGLSQEQIGRVYNSLKDNLKDENFTSSLGKIQANRCFTLIDVAYQILANPDLKNQYHNQKASNNSDNKDIHPRLGQLCVVSSMISLDQLKQAVDVQIKTKKPIGEVLVDMQFISQGQLEGLLMGQDLIDVPASNPSPLAQRLLQLGLVSEDMILIASVKQKSQNVDIGEVLVEEGWLDGKLLHVLKNASNV